MSDTGRTRAATGFASDFPNAEWLAALRARGTDPAFADARLALDDRVNGYHRALPHLPDRQAGYYHEFFCPDHAVQLIFNPHDGHHHTCPIDGRVFSGEPFDSAWGWSVNDALSDAALRAAVRRTLGAPGPAADDAGKDLALVKKVLLGYAERYRTLPPAPGAYPGPYKGIAAWSALDESVFIIRLAWASALVKADLSEAEIAAIRTGLLEPAFEHLRAVRYQQIQNVASWDNSANLTLAWILGEEAAIDDLLHGEFGVQDQLTRGVGADGLWWEGSLSYHYYVLAALSWTIRGLRAAGRRFEHQTVVESMFRAPLELAFPDGSLPAMNDCWYHIGLTGEVGHGIPNADGFYEMAYGWFGNPAFAWVVDQNRAAGPRRTLEALLDGATVVPEAAAAPVRTSRLLEPTGFAVLRSGGSTADVSAESGRAGVADAAAETDEADSSIELILKAGGDGDAHGHADQLGVQLFARGQRLALDPGTPGYGIALNDTWYRQTGSHSTVLLDSRSQPPATATGAAVVGLGRGRSMATASVTWPDLGEWPAVVARAKESYWTDGASESYASVRMQRWVVLTDAYAIDAFAVVAPGPHTVDWLWHERGRFEGSAEAAPGALAGTCGYDEARDVRRVSTAGPQSAEGPLTWAIDRGRVDLWLGPGDDEELYLASVPGNPAADRHDLLVRRRSASRTRFVAVIAPAGEAPLVRAVAWTAVDDGWTVEIETAAGTERWTVGPEGIVAID